VGAAACIEQVLHQQALADAAGAGDADQGVGVDQCAERGKVACTTQQRRNDTRQTRLEVGGHHRPCRGVEHPVFDAPGETVTTTGHGADQIAAEYLAQRVHLHRDIALLDHEAGPDTLEQLVLADQLAGPLDQDHEHVEGACAKQRRPAVDQQPSAGSLQLEAAEAQRFMCGRRARRLHVFGTVAKKLSRHPSTGPPRCIHAASTNTVAHGREATAQLDSRELRFQSPSRSIRSCT